MCRFCSGLLTGVVVCLICLVVAFKLINAPRGPAPAPSPDDPAPLTDLADPVPLPFEPVPVAPPPLAQLPQPEPGSPGLPKEPAPVPLQALLPPSSVVEITVVPSQGPIDQEEPVPPPTPEAAVVPETGVETLPPPTNAEPVPGIVVPEPLPPQPEPVAPPIFPAAAVAPAAPRPMVEISLRPTLSVRAAPAAIEAKAVVFTGTHSCKMGERMVLELPAAVRDQLGEPALLATPGPDHCLLLCPPAGLKQMTEQMERGLVGAEAVRAVRRRHFAQTEKLTIGADGCCTIPEALAKAAGLERDVVLVGVGDHLELWDAQRWQGYLGQNGARAVEPRVGSQSPVERPPH